LNTAIQIISEIQQTFNKKIILIGGKTDAEYVDKVVMLLPDKKNIQNLTGKTSLTELAQLIAASELVLTTDSGPAHVANAIGIPTVVLFGAGNEKNTAPYNEVNRIIIRLGKLPCEPCVKNVCVLYGTPKCLELLDARLIVNSMLSVSGDKQ
jgi:ADP-heptose:LPS heptosyltransferase